MNRIVWLFGVLSIFLFCCCNQDAALIKALKSDADYGTVKSLLKKGANPQARDENGRSAIDLAEEMTNKSQKKIDDIKSGSVTVANGGEEVIIAQLESEKEHNQMIVELLQANVR